MSSDDDDDEMLEEVADEEEVTVVTDLEESCEEDSPGRSACGSDHLSTVRVALEETGSVNECPLEHSESHRNPYVFLHALQPDCSCLSFDIVPDNLGSKRADAFPLSMTIVAGTMAPVAQLNNILVVKISNLNRTDDDDDDVEDSSEHNDNPSSKLVSVNTAVIRHHGLVNRIRATHNNGTTLAATWSNFGRVNIWNLSKQLKVVDDANKLAEYVQFQLQNMTAPIFSFGGHQKGGTAMDWNPFSKITLATGDYNKNIYIWYATNQASSWSVDSRPLAGHSGSIQALQWSPVEPSVLASCSVDKSICIWDVRAPPNRACMLTNPAAHASEVNTIHWNRNGPFLASGGDDSLVRVWDLRLFKENNPIVSLKRHRGPITTLEWHPTDASVLASGSVDNLIALWDLSGGDGDTTADVVHSERDPLDPHQLLFEHRGQKNIEELHWHSQMPGVLVSMGYDFNIFRTISV